jgi:hypothetical protein
MYSKRLSAVVAVDDFLLVRQFVSTFLNGYERMDNYFVIFPLLAGVTVSDFIDVQCQSELFKVKVSETIRPHREMPHAGIETENFGNFYQDSDVRNLPLFHALYGAVYWVHCRAVIVPQST